MPQKSFVPKDGSASEFEDLFEELRALRLRLARAEGVPSYIVFSDKTLRGMVEALPRNLQEMSEVSGVGAFKLEKYGKQFVAVVKEFLENHPGHGESQEFEDCQEFDECQETDEDLDDVEETLEEDEEPVVEKKVVSRQDVIDNLSRIESMDSDAKREVLLAATGVNLQVSYYVAYKVQNDCAYRFFPARNVLWESRFNDKKVTKFKNTVSSEDLAIFFGKLTASSELCDKLFEYYLDQKLGCIRVRPSAVRFFVIDETIPTQV